MRKSIDRDIRRKRRARARKAAARTFERPIQAALEQRALTRRQGMLDRLHDRLRDKTNGAVLIPPAVVSPSPTAAAEVRAHSTRERPGQVTPEAVASALIAFQAAVASQVSSHRPPAAATSVRPPGPTAPAGPDLLAAQVGFDGGRAVAETAARADEPEAAPQQPAGFLALLRRFRDSLLLPVVLAIIAIGLSNRLPSINPPGSHLSPAPAVSTSIPPSETPGAASSATIPADAVSPANPVAALAEVPPVEMIAALSTPPARPRQDAGITARETDFLPRTRACSTSDIATFKAREAPVEAGAFGVALAAAAEAQTSDFVVYNDDYYNLRYPGGDVPALYGVCSDVVIRAYRALGVDLQRLVHEARVGSGDTSIDHRRTETLRRFFARHGTKLPVTDFAEDYRPGDIVSYERPQNRGAQVHIAVVSNQTGPSGHPMIVHNRGWGPQIEDALFVDHITGHYRMTGQPKLLTSWGINKSHGPGLNSWSTLVRRAAIVRGSGRQPKAKSNPKLQ